jgi:hypothetical protein
VNNRPGVYTNPLGHCLADIGKFYEQVPDEVSTLIPEGTAGKMDGEFKLTRKNRILIRRQQIEAIDILRRFKGYYFSAELCFFNESDQ